MQIEKVDKKKTKFVNLYSQDGEDRMTILLKGNLHISKVLCANEMVPEWQRGSLLALAGTICVPFSLFVFVATIRVP